MTKNHDTVFLEIQRQSYLLNRFDHYSLSRCRYSSDRVPRGVYRITLSMVRM